MEDVCITKQVATLLKKERSEKFKSARAFARKHSIPISTYSQHETGKRGVNLDILAYYCKCLNIGFLSLLERLELKDTEKDLADTQEKQSVFSNYLAPRDITIPKDADALSNVIRDGINKYLQPEDNAQTEALIEHCTSHYFELLTLSLIHISEPTRPY